MKVWKCHCRLKGWTLSAAYRKDKGAVPGFKKCIYFLSLWIVSWECTRSLYHAKSHFCISFILKRKAPASDLPCWEGVNGHGRCVPPSATNWGKRRDAFVTICFLPSHQDSNLTELPQEGLRMHRVFHQASLDRGRRYFCFHVTFFPPPPKKNPLFFIIVPAPRPEKNPQKEISICTSKTPRQPELAWSSSHRVKCGRRAVTAPRIKTTQRCKVIPPVQSWWPLSIVACNIRHPNLSQPQRNRNMYYNLLLGIKISCIIICWSPRFIPSFRKAK